ncbi:wall-associated receptor kinase-like 22 [Heracleum sosnowskyi]|uniref:Wall-associated receptor kinase-like 22 n=1 Tax=Heracleum sosnowskyi TaxID=360622 RepID=A0AAD8I241_9APIA|nr:wall-associated receptor kinase-like 22 [Heracleum sosnowskyi]
MEENRIFDIVDSRIISEEKKEEMIAFADIAYRCLNLNRRKRPTMKQVVAELESIRNTPESPTAQENYEEVENEINELNATLESEVTSSSLGSTIYSVTNNISSFL